MITSEEDRLQRLILRYWPAEPEQVDKTCIICGEDAKRRGTLGQAMSCSRKQCEDLMLPLYYSRSSNEDFVRRIDAAVAVGVKFDTYTKSRIDRFLATF